jgi:hypothetical protein
VREAERRHLSALNRSGRKREREMNGLRHDGFRGGGGEVYAVWLIGISTPANRFTLAWEYLSTDHRGYGVTPQKAKVNPSRLLVRNEKCKMAMDIFDLS